jgi:hypothetical protein
LKDAGRKQVPQVPRGIMAVFNDLGKDEPIKTRFVLVESIKYLLGGEVVFSPKTFL